MSGNSISTLLRRSLPAIAYSPIQAEVSAAPMAIHEAASFTNVHPSAQLSCRGHPLRRRQVFQTSLFGCPGRPGTGPCGKCIPLGPSHSALFVANPDEDKGSIILSCLRASERRRNSVGIPDDCSVCHFRILPSVKCRPANASISTAAGDQRKTTRAAISRAKNNGTNSGGTSHSRKSNLTVSDILPPSQLRRERKRSQSPITAWGARRCPRF
jgi:hypothetical protein